MGAGTRSLRRIQSIPRYSAISEHWSCPLLLETVILDKVIHFALMKNSKRSLLLVWPKELSARTATPLMPLDSQKYPSIPGRGASVLSSRDGFTACLINCCWLIGTCAKAKESTFRELMFQKHQSPNMQLCWRSLRTDD